MKYYFTLQIKFFHRHIRANDIHPAFAYTFLLTAFIFLSLYLFKETNYAPYIYFFIPMPIWSYLSNTKRNHFLKTCFTRKGYQKLRIVENLLVAFPLATFLVYKRHYIAGLMLILAALLFSFFEVKKQGNFILPTPFYKYPFEFTSGFRRNFFVIMAAWMLTAIGIAVNNFNLAFFGLAIALLNCLSFYTLPENKFFVWIFSKSPRHFVFHKIKIAFWYTFILSAPNLTGLIVFFPQKFLVILAFQGLGFLIICVSLLGKYAAFPAEFNLTQAIVIAFSILFPPLIVVLLPLLYWLSLKKLNLVLK